MAHRGRIVLAGGAEFGGRMADVDRRALNLAGGHEQPVRIIPAAAAPDNNHRRAGDNGARWFRSLGATDVAVVPVIDSGSAADEELAAELRTARLIYLLGGFTDYLGQTLRESRAWDAIRAAHESGAVIAGSSAGAMVLCQYYFDPGQQQIKPGLNLVPNAAVLPHHDTFGRRWAARVGRLLPDAHLLGIDERTGMIDEAAGGSWSSYGAGGITLYDREHPDGFRAANPFSL